MEAVIAIIKNLLKNTRIVLILGVFLGLLLGLIIGWGLWPVQWTNATPAVLRADLQDDYMRMTIDSYYRTADINTAARRWDNLGEAAGQSFARVQLDPGTLDPNAIQKFSTDIQVVKGPILATPTEAASSATSNIVAYAAGFVLLAVLLAGGFYVFRLLRKNTGPVTASMQAAEINRQTAKTNFEELGLAPPIARMMATYVAGDDLYDESFGINTEAGEFLGEYGVAIAGELSAGTPKKVTAVEVWLFDKSDIKTSTKVFMSEHALNTAAIRDRLAAKGELVQAEPQREILLETDALQLLASIVDMQYGSGAPENSYFERITIELAVWPRQGGGQQQEQ